ncbi:hypothetical protein [Bradyrhizobium genosp. P]|uniref:hypothetical protein n=1 Tax=Bradyrhizobium genosp. P TaxID=83641 RepID=UPI003CF8E014
MPGLICVGGGITRSIFTAASTLSAFEAVSHSPHRFRDLSELGFFKSVKVWIISSVFCSISTKPSLKMDSLRPSN